MKAIRPIIEIFLHITLEKLPLQFQCLYLHKKDLLPVVILTLPILFGLLNVCWNSKLRWKPSEYLAAILNPIMVPYLGFQAIRKPDDEEIKEQYWRLKVSINIDKITRNIVSNVAKMF